MIVRKKYLAGGLIRGLAGQIIKRVVKGPKYKALAKEIKKRADKLYKGQDQTLKRHEVKIRKMKPMEEGLRDVVSSKGFSSKLPKVKEAATKALERVQKFTKQKKLEAREYIQSKGRKKHFKGGLIRKPKLAKRGF